jgi:hypothetical protein
MYAELENDDYASYGKNACCPPSQYLHERTQFHQDPGVGAVPVTFTDLF